MRRTAPWGLPLAALLAGALTALLADQPAADKAKDKTPLPVYETFADAIWKTPESVLLRPDQYQKLLDELARLRKQNDRPRLRTPSKLVLKGKVEGSLALLTAQFEFATEKAGELVRLGCGQAMATGVSLDGKTPALTTLRPRGGAVARAEDEEGFAVEVDKPGEHQLTLELALAVTTRPGGQGLTLDLPRAAITRLELELPAGAREVRVGGRPLAETQVEHRGGQLAGWLGAAERLDLQWRSAQAAAGSPVLSADGVVQVRIAANGTVTTEARMTLAALGGQVKQWRLVVPRGAEIKTVADDPRVAAIDTDGKKPIRIIQFKEASADPLEVLVTAPPVTLNPTARDPIPIGPFNVLGAARQAGTVFVSSAVPDWHLEFTPHADLTRRGATDDELRRDTNLVAALRYGPGAAERRGQQPWLGITAERVRGQTLVRPAHVVTLSEDAGGPRWQVQTTLTVTPRWADIDRLVVTLPAEYDFVEDGSHPLPPRVRGLTYDKASHQVTFRLGRGEAAPAPQPFAVRLEVLANARVDPRATGQTGVGLPRPVGPTEQDGTVVVRAPAALELVPAATASGGPELLRQSTHELSFRYPRRTPEQIAFGWRPHRPDVQVTSVIDLTLGARAARVRHELRYQLPGDGAGKAAGLAVRVPAAVAAGLTVHGGRLESDVGAEGRGDTVVSLVPADARAPALVLEYGFDLPTDRPGEAMRVPLVVPYQAARGETRVRVWSEAGLLPAAPAEGWSEQNIEEVPGRNRLPVLVLRAPRADRPLNLRLSQAGSPFAALIERALVRVEMTGNGTQSYRVSYRLGRLAGRHLDIEFPAQIPYINLQVRLDGKRVDPELAPADRAERKGRIARLRLAPDLVRGPAVLEVSYQLTPDRGTPLVNRLQPPRPLDGPDSVPTRWQIVAPPGRVVLAPEPGAGSPRGWGWRGWLLAPRGTLTGADLERWFAGGEPTPAALEASAGVVPTLVLWRDGSADVTLTHVPQQAWLLTCSLVLVLLGLALFRLPFGDRHTPAWVWLLLALLALLFMAGIAAVLLWPTLTGQIAYGCQPGAAVLLLIALVQWLLHERYRRQIVFLPSFSRPRGGSSLARKEGGRPHGEPSTVDAPATAGSSVERLP